MRMSGSKLNRSAFGQGSMSPATITKPTALVSRWSKLTSTLITVIDS